MMARPVHLVDTTLRDGEQSAGIAFSVEEKVMIAGWLDQAGIDQIEAGIPALGVSEIEAVSQIVAGRSQAVISTWNRLHESDIRTSFQCRPDIIHISAPISYAQLYVKLRRNKQWLGKALRNCVELAREHGYEVTVGFEDASRADICFMITTAIQLRDLGVKRIRYADTVGILNPGRISEDIRTLIRETGMDFQIHTHNDLGMAAANALAAAMAGAGYVDTTLCGIGERAGNCGMTEFLDSIRGRLTARVSHRDGEKLEKSLRPLLQSAAQAGSRT